MFDPDDFEFISKNEAIAVFLVVVVIACLATGSLLAFCGCS